MLKISLEEGRTHGGTHRDTRENSPRSAEVTSLTLRSCVQRARWWHEKWTCGIPGSRIVPRRRAQGVFAEWIDEFMKTMYYTTQPKDPGIDHLEVTASSLHHPLLHTAQDSTIRQLFLVAYPCSAFGPAAWLF